MNNYKLFRKYIVASSLFFLLFAVLSPVPVKAGIADNFQKFVDFLQQVEEYCPDKNLENVGFPMSADELQGAMDLILCVVDAGNTYELAQCASDVNDSLPDEVQTIADCYIFYMDGEYTALAQTLGGEFACAVLRVVTQINVCDLLKELVELAEAAYDFGKAIIEFFGNALAEVWGVAKDVGCALWLGGCDDSPPPPRYLTLLNKMQDHIQEGVEKREENNDNAFNVYLGNLKKQVLTEANKWIDNFNDKQSWLQLPRYSQNDIDKAAAKYVLLVNTAWSNDIVNWVQKERQDRAQIYINPFRLSQLIETVLKEYTPDRKDCLAPCIIIPKCEHLFSYDLYYKHIDRWKIGNFPVLSNFDMEEVGKIVQTNRKLCEAIVTTHRVELSDGAKQYLLDKKYCQKAGADLLLCKDSESFSTCHRLMTAFGKEGICTVDKVKMVAEVKAKLMARFRKEGSRFYDLKKFIQLQDNKIKKSSPQPIMQTREKFPCYRPTHKYFFGIFYRQMFPDLGEILLEPEMKVDQAYRQLQNSVKEAIEAMCSQGDCGGCTYQISPIDPLMVAASSSGCVHIAEENNSANFEFSLQKPNLKVDGLDQPLIYFDLKKELFKNIKNPPRLVKRGKDVVGPIEFNPVNQLNIAGVKLMGKTGKVKKRGISMQVAGLQNRKITGKGGMSEIAAPSARKTMSGHVPSGQSFPNGKTNNIAARVSKTGKGESLKLKVIPIAHTFRAPATVRITLLNAVHSRVPFELRYRADVGRSYKRVKHPLHKFSRTNGRTGLTLSLREVGQYQIRFRENHKAPWTIWQSFQVINSTGKHSVMVRKRKFSAGREINSQPESPGKEMRPGIHPKNKKIREKRRTRFATQKRMQILPPKILKPQNGRKFRMFGKSIHIKAEISHAAEHKVQIEVQYEKNHRFVPVQTGLRIKRMKAVTSVDILIRNSGSYRLRVKDSTGGARWSNWTRFRVYSLVKKLVNKPHLPKVK